MLQRITIKGFKSISSLEKFELKKINIFLGQNGAGKTNLISFFRLLNNMTFGNGTLQLFVGILGGANSILFGGANQTPQIEAELDFDAPKGSNEYAFRLFHAAKDSLIFADEKIRFSDRTRPTKAEWRTLGSGHTESKLIAAAESDDKTAKSILHHLRNCVVYQFHNTSEKSRIRQKFDVEDSGRLKYDGANLASVLARYQIGHPSVFAKIQNVIRLVYPQFIEFVFEPVGGYLLLQWREKDSDAVFGSHQASDGTLRLMALATLLMQPGNEMPSVLIIDEPELGLHPSAIKVVSDLIRSAAAATQVIMSTQSVTLINHFAPEDVVVVERDGAGTQMRRVNADGLKDWLGEFTMGELWEKNVIGGRP